MGLRYRPMTEADVPACINVLTSVPVLRDRYRSAIGDTRVAWRRLIGCDAMKAAVFEEVDGIQVTVWGVGVGVFVHDEFVRELKTPPLCWFGPKLATRIVRGPSPVLTDEALREANSTNGVNLLVWEGCVNPEFSKRPDALYLMVTAFLDLFRGYRCKEAISHQADNAARLQWQIDGGGRLWDPAERRYVRSSDMDLGRVVKKPFIVGTTPDVESSRPGSWVSPIFNYQEPTLGFSRAEQRLLVAALPGRTDEELCRELGLTISTVKALWRSIYGRAALAHPELSPYHGEDESMIPERGKEKRRHLLAFLREHPEELRPVMRRARARARPGRQRWQVCADFQR